MAAYTTIDDPEAYFQASTYTGNGTAIGSGGLAVTLDGDTDMQPDMVFFCNLGTTQSRNIHDSVRGVTETLYPDSTAAEYDNNETLTTFGSDGFTVGSDNSVNQSSQTISAWCWKASGSTASNSVGDITTTVSANTTSGFAIVSYNGNGVSGAEIGHGIGIAPKFIQIKNRDVGDAWVSYTTGVDGSLDYFTNGWGGTNAKGDSGLSVPTTTIFDIHSDDIQNNSSENYIAYVWAEVQGFSKIGSYTGNGNADGTFIYTGFRPAFVMTKISSASGEGWVIRDNKRNPFNVAAKHTRADGNAVESTSTGIYADFLSNGFKIRGTDAAVNTDGATYIYMAFAEAPFVNSKGVPCNAR